jgi:hypothetical protein
MTVVEDGEGWAACPLTPPPCFMCCNLKIRVLLELPVQHHCWHGQAVVGFIDLTMTSASASAFRCSRPSAPAVTQRHPLSRMPCPLFQGCRLYSLSASACCSTGLLPYCSASPTTNDVLPLSAAYLALPRQHSCERHCPAACCLRLALRIKADHDLEPRLQSAKPKRHHAWCPAAGCALEASHCALSTVILTPGAVPGNVVCGRPTNDPRHFIVHVSNEGLGVCRQWNSGRKFLRSSASRSRVSLNVAGWRIARGWQVDGVWCLCFIRMFCVKRCLGLNPPPPHPHP